MNRSEGAKQSYHVKADDGRGYDYADQVFLDILNPGLHVSMIGVENEIGCLCGLRPVLKRHIERLLEAQVRFWVNLFVPRLINEVSVLSCFGFLHIVDTCV